VGCIDTNCIEQGKILFENARFVSEETYNERVSRLIPQADDILFAREGTIGTDVLVPQNI
jgi:type I restriction enzyme S subunit